MNTGRLSVITGCMYSGKTEELVRTIRRALYACQRIECWKPQIDNRYEGESKICTHTGVCIDAIAKEHLRDVTEDDLYLDFLFIDEVQFFKQEELLHVIDIATRRGVNVVVSGTDTDFLGRPFGVMGYLMCIADEVKKLDAICVVCGSAATRNQRLIDGKPATRDSPLILVGSKGTYEARCKDCHKVV